MKICGVDDAGRGSMIGPMVIAGVSIDKSKLSKLRLLGVKDSKKLTPSKRESLYKEIIKICDGYYVAKISPKIIDKNVFKHNLNHLEAKYMAKIISKLDSDISYVDSCDVNQKRFGVEISKLAKKDKIRSFHHADSKFVIVSAASILAKVTRDREIAKLEKNHDLGSGYPSDSKTVNFVKNYYQSNRFMPEFVRKSWKPTIQILKAS